MRSIADAQLSPREKQAVLIYSTLGTYSKTAEAMCISETTVKTHISNVLQRKHCSYGIQLVPVCLSDGDITVKMLEDTRKLYEEELPNG